MKIINKRYVERVPVGKIKPHPRNSNRGDEAAIGQSIATNGFYGACIVNERTGFLLAGEHRWKAAKAEGAKSVPVLYVDCDEEHERRILQADNQINRLGGFDVQSLIEELEAIKSDYGSLVGTGFDDAALSSLSEDLANGILNQHPGQDDDSDLVRPEVFEGPNAVVKTGQCDDDETPEPEPEIVSRLGDLWLCGSHRVMCGDSTDAASVTRLMDGSRADMIFTDPPYNLDYDPEARASTFSEERLSHKLGKIQNDKKSAAEFRDFLDAVFTCADLVIKPGRPIYICHADTEGHHFRGAFIAQPWKLQSCLIWKKSVLCFDRSDYHWIHEPILYGWKSGEAHVWEGDRKQTSVIEVATEHYDKSESDTGGKYVHPTQKPVKLILVAIVNSTRSRDAVIDLFGGSGSTLIACEKTERRARLMEIDPKYVDVIVRRYEKFTGESATLENDRRTFEEIAAERSSVAA